ncbi:MAG: DUF4114 domain-containing protein [Deltaproteobacteria bacterium]|nr:DUF4114 domain-containing protein [Deltaproteobacteria bacterium]
MNALLTLALLIRSAAADPTCTNVDLVEPQFPAAALVNAGGGEVAVTFCDGESAYTSDVGLAAPASIWFATGHLTPVGNTVDLGVFSVGEELVFAIYVRNTGYTYYSGPASRNPDGQVHAAVSDLGDGLYLVGFEDLFGGGDRDYDDINIIVQAEAVIVCPDADADGVCDDVDACPGSADPFQLDTDGDGLGDACDTCPLDVHDDSDGDGSCDSDDLCPGEDDGLDGDLDDVPDACDACPLDLLDDSDGDGSCDSDDLCPGADDADDGDLDGVPDACDACPLDVDDDSDGDGSCDSDDLCPGEDDTLDADLDGTPDACDTCPLDADDDSDGDGLCADVDACPDTTADAPTRGLGVNRWADIDGDGIFDTVLPKGRGPGRGYTIDDTDGCSCAQIIDSCGYGAGHVQHGCSISVMDAWVAGGCH